MATPLMPEQIDDFVVNTLHEFIKNKWVDISLDKQKYYFAERFGRGKNFSKRQKKGGKIANMRGDELSWRIQVQNTGSFADSELYGTENVTVKDLVKEAKVQWTKQRVGFKYDIDEKMFQEGPNEIIRNMDVRRHSMFNDFHEGMETRMWTSPTSSSQSPRKPFGIPFWVQQSSTAAFGFNGGNPSGFTSGRAGIDSDTYANWKNGTFTYNTMSDDDGLKKMAEACVKCHFMAPHSFKELGGDMPDHELFTVWGVVDQMERALKNSNDNIGHDLGKYRGSWNNTNLAFRGIPVCYVPALDETGGDALDSNDPIYGIDWNNLSLSYNKGRDMQILKPLTPDQQPTVRDVYMINWCQFYAQNLRSHFVGRKA